MTDEPRKPASKKPGKVVHKLTRSGHVPSPLSNQAARANVDVENEPLAFDRNDIPRESAGTGFTWGKLVLITLVVALLGIGGYYALISLAPPSPETNTAKATPEASTPVVIESLSFKEDPLEVALAFVNADDPQDRLQYVRNPEEVELRMSEYPEQALKHPVKELVQLGIVNNSNVNVAGFGVIFEDGTRRYLPVVATEEGTLVDWDSYARYGTASWTELLNGDVDAADVRVFAKPVAYYNYQFEDGEVWDGFQLVSPDLDAPVFGYAKEGTKVAEILNSTLPWTDGEGLRMTLRISAIGDSATHRQFLIDRVLAYDWVRVDEDLQDTWVSQPPNKTAEE